MPYIPIPVIITVGVLTLTWPFWTNECRSSNDELCWMTENGTYEPVFGIKNLMLWRGVYPPPARLERGDHVDQKARRHPVVRDHA